jgi:hypothetical protein
MAQFIAIYGSLAVICAVLAGIVSYVKRRDPSYWIAITFLFPPAVFMLLLMKKNTGPRPVRPSLDSEDRQDGLL